LVALERSGSGAAMTAAPEQPGAPGKHRLKLFGKLGRGAFGTV
jgi:hypothetical protein